MKICLVTSSGGHLAQLYSLKNWWQRYDRFWVTFKKEDAQSILADEKNYWAHFPTNRNLKNFLKNLLLAVKIICKERPDMIISTGAGVAVPFFWVGKCLRAKLVYLEVFDRIDSATLTGKLVYPITDKFLVQWEEQRKFYPKGEFWGQAL